MGEFHEYIYQGYKYKLYVPGPYTAEVKSPLMVMLHGCGQDPDDFAAGTKMNDLAEEKNFLVLYPNMNHLFNPSDPAGYNPFGCWNWFLDKNQHRGQGHPKLICEIIEEVKRGYTIDPKKVYAAGLSAGGSLACILGVTYPDVFAAIGICSGLAYDAANVFFLTDPMAEDAKKSMEKGVPDPFACGHNAYKEMGQHKKIMRVIVFHGVCDTTVHPINGQQVITQWAQTNFMVEGGKGNVDVTSTRVKAGFINGKSYTQHIYNDRNEEPQLELWMIDQLGHAWSGGSTNGSYTDPEGPNASEIILGFFTGIETPLREQQKVTTDQLLDITPVNATSQEAEHVNGKLPKKRLSHSSEQPKVSHQATINGSQKPAARQNDHSLDSTVLFNDKSNEKVKAPIESKTLEPRNGAVEQLVDESDDAKITEGMEKTKKTSNKIPDLLEGKSKKPQKKNLLSSLLSKIRITKK